MPGSAGAGSCDVPGDPTLVRHEALLNRMEPEDHHRPAVAAAGL